ncbi:hypothetical protein [Phenylobacterium montanum]|uniref:Uncharacterized protein n=1 Tax=Phenylobacterium montanum TaxID=2823693 RepID=A0A975IXE5_9CAUL|nr:hypothetical protein [Caulobacter sp. S6]QUD90554.1 hypothetical protein KCG34_12130 [Caulobacter sp. S6]
MTKRVTLKISGHPNTLAVLTDHAETASIHKGGLPYEILKGHDRATFVFGTEEAAAHFIGLARTFEHLWPLPEIVRELSELETAHNLHPRRRMVVIRREDGNFTFAEQYHYVTQNDGVVIAEGWASLRPEGIYSTANEAEAEAIVTFSRRYSQSAGTSD